MADVYKKMSKSGAITIPKHVRTQYGIPGGDAYKISVKDDGDIVLQPHTPRCIFCGTAEHVTIMNGRGICAECVVKAKEALLHGE
ncbi:MAG: AbrB/MazE/SpoVT family DNA-binding domain-containing protein [Lachnospiraceae bacterium]|nr:AbrB/MazE/SpoVT family DNA-binding domain-containing protein [Lachnospiraceae bacterium]MBR1567530.1 AbrB/MazE/SpoVT family DNA-binding domain-containing protein [Lachnospiraceae bacterium]MBR1568686.1 AbrB/MazE/SpoVT family DNA-binding domain-containing protein [Lachnospiraceae bacterium]